MSDGADPLTAAIARELRRTIAVHGTKQSTLAAAVGVHQVTVGRWRQGTRSMNVEHLIRVCRFYRMGVGEFLGRVQLDGQNVWGNPGTTEGWWQA